MNPEIMTVADEMTTDELARYLIEHEISDAPVVEVTWLRAPRGVRPSISAVHSFGG